MINIHTAITQGVTQLKGSHEARLESEILLAYVLNKNRTYLYTYPEGLLTTKEQELYQQTLAQRCKGMPIAYITGVREFWSLPLQVNQHTLIPRHETELLVQLALELMPEHAALDVLDLGTGCGTIALALAKERPHWNISACDNSQAALNLAQSNARNLKLTQINFYHSDWFSQLPHKRYHLIVSNPPYLAEQDPHLKQSELSFEPLSALVSGQDGLASLQCIVEQSAHYLMPQGLLLLEHGYDQKISISTILKELNYDKIQCWQDLQGLDRVSGGWFFKP